MGEGGFYRIGKGEWDGKNLRTSDIQDGRCCRVTWTLLYFVFNDTDSSLLTC
jgi:hypothetical protein